MPPDRKRLARLADRRASVLTRAELLAAGATTDWISRQVTDGRWQRAFPGVYITHTGEPGWRTVMVAALRYAGPGAALSHGSAAQYWFAEVRRLGRGPVEVSVPWRRTVTRQPGLRLHRRRTMPEVWPGLVAVTTDAETVVDLVDRATSVDDVVGVVTRGARRVRPEMVAAAAARRKRLRHRALLADLVNEVGTGIESPLERRYHHDVEDVHGLPRSELQVREVLSGQAVRADRRYRAYRTRVELDGQLAHPDGRTDRDTWRDNAALLETGEITLRYRWPHVAGDPCGTAAQVVVALRRGGWTGVPRPCRPGCPVAAGAPRT